ncbi:MAG TPA: rhodanese-like domain-containing protein [Puia sp.]|jgi:rhodanese-related sulfurtransferase
MLQTIKNILGLRPAADLKDLWKHGAQIIDVRSPGEFQSGHIKGSLNIPLDILGNSLSKIKKDRPVITCCASGIRSASAESLLKSKGLSEVFNGGGWMSLRNKIS